MSTYLRTQPAICQLTDACCALFVLSTFCLFHRHTSIASVCDKKNGFVLVARTMVFPFEIKRKLHRLVREVVQVGAELVRELLYAFDEVCANVIPQFAVSRQTVVLFLIEPSAESRIEPFQSFCVAIAEKRRIKLAAVFAEKSVILACKCLPFRIAEKLNPEICQNVGIVEPSAQLIECMRITTCWDYDVCFLCTQKASYGSNLIHTCFAVRQAFVLKKSLQSYDVISIVIFIINVY